MAQAVVWTWTNANGDNGFPSNETMVVAMDGVNRAIHAAGETLNMDGMRVAYNSGNVGAFEQTGGVGNL